MKANHMNTQAINAVQQEMIDKLIRHFETIQQRPCRWTVQVMTNVLGVLEREAVTREVRYLLDGRATGGGFRYDHPGAFARFRAEFFRQWDARQSR